MRERRESLSVRIYRILLYIYPAPFRREFGEDIAQLFRDRLREAEEAGGLHPRFKFWRRAIGDLLAQALKEWWCCLSRSRPGRSGGSVPEIRYVNPLHDDKAGRMETLIQDIRFGVRMLVKSPVFSVAAVLCLAIGIGANAAIFSFLYGILSNPLGFEGPDELISVETVVPERGWEMATCYPDFAEWRERSHSFESIMAWDNTTYTLSADGIPERIQGADIFWEFTRVLRVDPLEGRAFIAEEDQEDAPGAALIGYGLWQRLFGGDPDLVGSTITINREAVTVVGIMPVEFKFPGFAEIWMPLRRNPLEGRGTHNLGAGGRLKPGVSIEQAQADLEAIAADLAARYPENNAGVSVRLKKLAEEYIGGTREPVLIFYVVVSFILLLACANVANLMLARAASREGEIAVRASLGAGRRRIVRMLLTESLVLALLGGALGLLLGRIGRDLIVAGVPVDIPYYIGHEMHLPVILCITAIALLSGVLFGLVPALNASRSSLTGILQGTGGRIVESRKGGALRSFLVAFEVGLALVILVGATLMMRSIVKLRTVETGFDAGNLLTVRISLPEAEYDTPEDRYAFYSTLLDRIGDLPGVTGAVAAYSLPMARRNWGTDYYVEGTEPPPPGQSPNTDYVVVTPWYFRTMGITLLQGREFNHSDVAEGSTRAVIVNRKFAEQNWPGENPLGKRIRYYAREMENDPWMEVVGVVEDVHRRGLSSDVRVAVYRPHAQHRLAEMSLAVKTASDPLDYVDRVRAEIWAVDPDLPPYEIRTMEQVVLEGNWEPPLYTWLFGIFSTIALILALVGIYGVVAFSVAQRSREFGIRLALGATSGQVVQLVLRQGIRLTVFGLAGGLLVAFLVMRFAGSIFYGVSPTDPVIYTLAALTMAAAAIAASYIPARRATVVDPVETLRAE